MSQIQQEVNFSAMPKRIYHTLLDADSFAKFTGAPARIDAVEGGSFLCFGKFILGRNVELIPGKRIVQAWRVFNWSEGVYSIVRFQLQPVAGKTTLLLDQNGVPDNAVKHVDAGWAPKYWDPLRRYLES